MHDEDRKKVIVHEVALPKDSGYKYYLYWILKINGKREAWRSSELILENKDNEKLEDFINNNFEKFKHDIGEKYKNIKSIEFETKIPDKYTDDLRFYYD